jgi:hypothetical protein
VLRGQIKERNVETPHHLVVLRNGEVLDGQVTQTADRIVLSLPGREISLRARDVDVVARSLDDAYRAKSAKLGATDVEGRLDLVAWCMRHELFVAAQTELTAIAAMSPASRRLRTLEAQLRKQVAADGDRSQGAPSVVARNRDSTIERNRYSAVQSSHSSSVWPARPVSASSKSLHAPLDDSPLALDRFVKGLPGEAVEQFTVLQPMILRGCATAGCHAPGNTSGFTLLRSPPGTPASRRLTQRNLHSIVQLVDFQQAEESRLLQVARQPHGPLQLGVFGDARSVKYRQLVKWVSNLTGVEIESNPASAPASSSSNADLARSIWERAGVADEEVLGNRDTGGSALRVEPNQPAAIGPNVK